MEILYWLIAMIVAISVFNTGHKGPAGGNLIIALILGALWPILVILTIITMIYGLLFGRKKNGLDM